MTSNPNSAGYARSPSEPEPSLTADVSGWCRIDQHDRCSGRLLAATGHHWWCACPHHDPVPEPSGGDEHKAWDVWRAARTAAVAGHPAGQEVGA